MWNWAKQFFKPPTFADEDRGRTARLLHVFLLTMGGVSLLVSVLLLVVGRLVLGSIEAFIPLSGITVFVLALALSWFNRRGYTVLSSLIFVGLLWLVLTWWMVGVTGFLRDQTAIAYPLLVLFAGLLLGERAVWSCTALNVATIIASFWIEKAGLLHYGGTPRTIADLIMLSAIFVLTGALLQQATHSLNLAVQRARTNEQAQRQANLELQSMRASLEERVAERTAEAQRRARYLEAAAQIGQAAARLRNVVEMLPQVAELVSRHLDVYHVAVFLLDQDVKAEGRYATLQTATSPGGQQLLAQGYRARTGEESVVGYVLAHNEPRLVLDDDMESKPLGKSFLAFSHSGIALPLRVGERMWGVLDLQSVQRSVFAPQDVPVLQMLADQLAVAIENLNLFAEAQRSLEAQRQAYGEFTHQAWIERVREQARLGFVSTVEGVFPSKRSWQPEMVNAYQSGQIVQTDADVLAVPIRIRDHIEGVMRLRKPQAGRWTAQEVALMETLAQQVSDALDSARLYQDTQNSAARERLIGQVSSQMRASLNVNVVLQTALREIGDALGMAEIEVRMGQPGDGLSKEEQG